MPRSIHDNYVLGYSVNHPGRSIVVRTEKRQSGQPLERTDIRFEGVLGYHFRDSLGGILTDVYPCDLESLMRDSSFSLLFKGWADWAWPFQGCDGDPVAHARAAGAIAYCVDSAIGFDGFVVCQSMTIEAAQHGAAADDRPQAGDRG
ncbi:MAG: hypothetical protein H6838_11175 [Planctomycetes bacterium]|nr:hypothetical protein [Planctomycetota bacterium]